MKNEMDMPDLFAELSRKVIDLMTRTRTALFELDSCLALRINAEGDLLSREASKAEGKCNAELMSGSGIISPELRFYLVKEAQRCNRLGRIVHQIRNIATCIKEIADKVECKDVLAFKPLFLMAEVQLKDAVLSILRKNEELAFNVRRKDDDLDSLYATELENIFRQASDNLFYDFRTGTGLLFILRAIERIGDHSKQLAVPSFYRLQS